jgi:hypothetical protein
MVIAVLSAMAGASKIILPYMNNTVDLNAPERYEQLSKYILLNAGIPSDWGRNGQVDPQIFGIGKGDSGNPYELDIDKVTRLSDENQYSLSYADAFASSGFPDVSFSLGIKPVFEVIINLTAIFEAENATVYRFEILTEKDGASVSAQIKCRIIAENYANTTGTIASDGKAYLNITISDSVNGPALLVAFARHAYNDRIVSYGSCVFAHNSTEPETRGTYVKLSPLDYLLNASVIHPETNLSEAYAFTFDYGAPLEQVSRSNSSDVYRIPRFLDSSPTVIVLTGRNATSFFAEWVAYPQVPAHFGADFASSKSLSSIYAYTYPVTIGSVIYTCTVRLGGPRE